MTITEWLADKIDSHTMHDACRLFDLREMGIDVTESQEDGLIYMTLTKDGKEVRIYPATWEQDFNAMMNRGLPFTVIRPSHEGEPMMVENDTPYVIVGTVEEVHPMMGYIWDTPDARSSLTVDGEAISRALARLLIDEAPGDNYSGRGFSHRANIGGMKEKGF